MSSIDSLLFDSVRDYIPDDVTSVESMDRVFFFNLCVQCLSLLDESILEFVHFIVDEEDLNHSICCDLADGFARVGYTAEIGFSHFMYPEPEDITRILMWLTSSISFANEQECLIG
ncbi:coiled-coil domain-containing protein [Blastocystis sp. subtype 4]|uniref:coiled-coil domain-containing protein n=1 Tax=Blastocystis sp. subtype 4 TaxID=944170 RepID=UPI000711EE52|nr:coiled-coil domain-containing protein [Blastocystis sp. subtype 4]KNB44228.1 coiled-coil domain-containing protein [Blastocystis sp. subtype 4]|eukprot:XP_014527671.1 coiled-coil domain-containing protein [Blastocystis sp. subtype 4]